MSKSVTEKRRAHDSECFKRVFLRGFAVCYEQNVN